ncbi:large ribosomal subunit protein uL30w-like isoform X1 [Musa acuminata AAA Group]|uniref:large ribosomal subunit protein uL30w-like isoform X1 n=1 Tax=Musa acuminata AAA Group TaxID=214697 RepID=UPI0031E08312
MATAEAKAVIPESALKKRKREEQWALVKKQDLDAKKKKARENRKLIFSRAKQYAKEYESQEKQLIRLKREARMKGGVDCSPKAMFLFIICIRGWATPFLYPFNIYSLLCHKLIFFVILVINMSFLCLQLIHQRHAPKNTKDLATPSSQTDIQWCIFGS